MLEKQDGDRFDLTRNGRRLLSDASTTEIRRYLKKKAGQGDKVYWEEHDGYLTPFR